MLYKWLKKQLPTRAEITQSRYLRWLGVNSPHLWHITRHSVSCGVAVGLLVPFQMLLTVMLGVLVDGNLLIAVGLTWITNPITFIPINFFIFKVGQWVINDPAVYHTVEFSDWHGKMFKEICEMFWVWLQGMGEPFLIGLPIVAIGAAIIGYALVNLFWYMPQWWRNIKNFMSKMAP